MYFVKLALSNLENSFAFQNSRTMSEGYLGPTMEFFRKIFNCKICSILTIKTLERSLWCRSGLFIVNFEQIFDVNYFRQKNWCLTESSIRPWISKQNRWKIWYTSFRAKICLWNIISEVDTFTPIKTCWCICHHSQNQRNSLKLELAVQQAHRKDML